MNAYFFIIATLQSIKDLSPVDPMSTWVPIFCIFLITYIREGIDDYKNHIKDNEINSRKYIRYRNGSKETILSKDIRVGDIIILKKDEEAPSDFILLYASDESGICPLETSNLDGETNLKERHALRCTQEIGIQNISNFFGTVTCQAPNPNINEFKGTICSGSEIFSIGEDNFVQCGTKVKNIDFVAGVVAYCGKETKLGLNSVKPPIKWTKVEKYINKMSLTIFIVQWSMAFVAGTIANVYQINIKNSMKYLEITSYKLIDWIIMYVRFFLLTTTMIPISLKVILDMCKMIYAKWIENDKKMTFVVVGEKFNTKCHNTSVIEDLGAIEYIFADKTGTLTDNVMELKKISAKGTIFGGADENGSILNDNYLASALSIHNNDVYKLIRALLLCHTLKIENDDVFGCSPEEVAFVKGIKKLGFSVSQIKDVIEIESAVFGIRERYKVLDILPFNYERRRMSVIVQNVEDNKITIITKGAGEVIESLCSFKFEEYSHQHDYFASIGLRVMGVSEREINEKELSDFYRERDICCRNIERRNEEENQLFTRFESNSTLLGLAAIEDRLQEGVPESIETLREAGIKIWMITGDIMQTAIKIAHTTKLIQNNDDVFCFIKEKGLSVRKSVEQKIAEVRNCTNSFCLAIDGSQANEILSTLMSPSFVNDFRELASKAKSVVVSRATPSQKAQIVDCFKRVGKMTLAIGDGGNDVTMIRTAHVGVGIVGKEGSQASSAADFSTYRFKNLVNLLLIHGRYSCYRTSWLSQFCFYKSTVVCLIQIFYMLFNGFSGASFFNSFNLMSYNAFFTVLPVFYFLQDMDVSEEFVMRHPSVYSDSQSSVFLNKTTLFKWYSKGVYQALIITLMWNMIYNVENVSCIDANSISLEEIQEVVYTALILIVLITVTLDTQNFTFHNYVFVWGSLLLYIFACLTSSSIPGMKMLKETFLVGWRIFNTAPQLVSLITFVSISIIPPYFIRGLLNVLKPTRTQKIIMFE